MTTYRAIAASEVDPESPVTSELVTALKDNVLAMFEGDATASAVRMQRAGLADAIINRVKISTTLVTSAYSVAPGGGLNVTMNAYSFFPSITGSNATLGWGTATNEAPVVRISNSTGGTVTGDLIWRYINA